MTVTATMGQRLRAVRAQRGMSLNDVQVASGGTIRGSVLGAYERGERKVSVARAQALADFYDVPLDRIIPVVLDARQRTLRDLAETVLAGVLAALPRPCVITGDGRIREAEAIDPDELVYRVAPQPGRVLDLDRVADDYEQVRSAG